MKKEEENKTIGLILCADKKEVIEKYTIPDDSNIYFKIFIHLSKKEDLVNLIAKDL